jgi:hypothetical protein
MAERKDTEDLFSAADEFDDLEDDDFEAKPAQAKEASSAGAAVDDDFLDDDEEPVVQSTTQKSEQTGEGKSKTKKIALAVGGGVLIAGIVVAGILFQNQSQSPEESLNEVAVVEDNASNDNVSEMFAESEFEDVEDMEEEESEESEFGSVAPLPVKYYVQVANCIYRECVGENRRLLSRQGYRTRVETSVEELQMVEVISQKIYSQERAQRLAEEINKDSALTGFAHVKSSGGWYQLSMGLFPHPETAERLQQHLNQKFEQKMVFDNTAVAVEVEQYRVYAGGYREEQQAVRLKSYLERREPLFENMFITGLLPNN